MATKPKIYIKPSKRGSFTAAAKRRGMGVKGFASKVLANPDNYSPGMVKKANFSRNAAKWKKELGGYLDQELGNPIIEETPVDNTNSLVEYAYGGGLPMFQHGSNLGNVFGNYNQPFAPNESTFPTPNVSNSMNPNYLQSNDPMQFNTPDIAQSGIGQNTQPTGGKDFRATTGYKAGTKAAGALGTGYFASQQAEFEGDEAYNKGMGVVSQAGPIGGVIGGISAVGDMIGKPIRRKAEKIDTRTGGFEDVGQAYGKARIGAALNPFKSGMSALSDPDATTGEKIGSFFWGIGTKGRYKRKHERMIKEKKEQDAYDRVLSTNIENKQAYAPTFKNGGILPPTPSTDYELPDYLQGSLSGEDVSQRSVGGSGQDEFGGQEGVSRSVRTLTPRQYEGEDIYLLKDSDALAKEAWAKTAFQDGKRHIYTTDPNAPSGAYARDTLTEFPGTNTPPRLTRAGEGFGTYQMGGDLPNKGFPAPNEAPVINTYDGNSDTHKQGIGGVPVDAKGNPATTSKQSAIGLTEKGEVTWNGYVFSNKLKV